MYARTCVCGLVLVLSWMWRDRTENRSENRSEKWRKRTGTMDGWVEKRIDRRGQCRMREYIDEWINRHKEGRGRRIKRRIEGRWKSKVVIGGIDRLMR